MKILLTPLNWGLGHATRSAALAERFRKKGYEIHWAADGDAAHWLKENYPLDFHYPLKDLQIHYGKSVWKSVLFQSRKIHQNIIREHRLIAALVHEIKPDVLISDNRYGCYHPSIQSVFLTHQLRPRLPKILRFLQPISDSYFYHLMTPFQEIWVPDTAERTYSGSLSKPFPKLKILYSGILSRFLPREKPITSIPHTLILCSGPSSSRKVFLMEALKKRVGTTYVVGVNGKSDTEISYFANPDQELLQDWLQFSSILIARPGYSTLMDVAALHRTNPNIWIPTPGQTEQEYLADRIQKQISLQYSSAIRFKRL